MFPSKTLLSLILITLSAVDASPLSRRASKATLPVGTKITNSKGIVYTTQVGVGAGTYTLMVDTASANTFVGADKAYAPGPNSQDTGETASVNYGSQSWSGEEFLDDVTLSGLVISQQSVGVASSSTGFEKGIDGILGVGPVGLSSGTTNGGGTVPTVLDNLYNQGTITEETFGVYFIPASESGTGGLTFGGYDDSVTASSVNYVPITSTSPASNSWGIDGSISYDGTTILSSTAGVVDTAAARVLIATDAFKKYQSATGGILDSATGWLSITSAQYDNLKPLKFNIGAESYELTQNGQIWPRSLNNAIGGNSNAIYLVVGDSGSPSGSGLDFTLGYTFLQRYYSVYDTANKRVGFASTTYTNSTTN